jgi:hypothetical protein
MIKGFSLQDMLNPQKPKVSEGSLKSALDERMFPFRKAQFKPTKDTMKKATLSRVLSSMDFQGK